MSEQHESEVMLEQAGRRRSASERFAHLSDRLARSLPAVVRGDIDTGRTTEPGYPSEEQDTTWYDVVPRFPIVRSGYECASVDEHVAMLEQDIAELERENDDLRARPPASGEVEAEIKRIGEQTSAILLAAHDRAREMTRAAEEQAERCLTEARAKAHAITEEATRKRAESQGELERIAGERSRLLADMERLAGTLSTVARESAGRSEVV